MKKNFLAFLAFLSLGLSYHANAQLIANTVVCSTGVAGYSGDNGPAILAKMNGPIYINADGYGAYYVSDAVNNVVRKVDAFGIITTFAGNGTAGFSGDTGPATAASVNYVAGMAIDAVGNVYLSDRANNRIRKVSTSGVITTFAGTGAAATSGDGGPATAASFNAPYGISFDTSGNLYVVEQDGGVIRKISPAGIVSPFAGDGGFGFGGDSGPATVATFHSPQCIYVSHAGDVYLNDQGNHRLRKISSTGIITTIAGDGSVGYGGDGGPSTAAVVNLMGDITMDAAGTLYFSDDYGDRLRQISTSGIINTFAGNGIGGHTGDGGLATSAQFDWPNGLTMSCGGVLLTCEINNNDVRRIGPANEHPHFITPADTLHPCVDFIINSLDTLLGIQDTDACQGLSWTILSAPAHGVVTGLPARTMSTGGITYPSGVIYTPVVYFTGIDSFTVVVFDGVDTSMRKIYVNASSCPTGVANVTGVEQQMTVMPNPSQGTFSLVLTSSDAFTGEAIVTNMTGQRVAAFAVSSNKDNDIHLTAPSGVYFITVNTPAGSMTQKILIAQ